MERKLKICLNLLLMSIVLSQFLLICIPQIERVDPASIQSRAALGGGTGAFANYTAVGDFINYSYYSSAYPPVVFNKTWDFLYLETADGGGDTYIWRNNIITIDVVLLQQLQLRLNWNFTGSAFGLECGVKLIYTDASSEWLFYYNSASSPDGDPRWTVSKVGSLLNSWVYALDWLNMTLPVNNKTVDRVLIGQWGIATWRTQKLQIYDEIWVGYLPYLANWQTFPATIESGSVLTFYCEAENFSHQGITAGLLGVQVRYVATGNEKQLNMTTWWTHDNIYYADEEFRVDGVYEFVYFVRNRWNIIYMSPIYTISITNLEFPKYSYLNVRSYEYRDVPEELFYIYLGQDESEILFDFRDRFGTWLTMGTAGWAFGYERIIFNCSSGGIKSDFSHIAAGRQYNLENRTLEFDLRTSQDRLVIIVDPSIYDMDYLLLINSTYQGQWVTVRIPFYMFQSFDTANNYIGELGFYGINGIYELANIKLSDLHYSTVLINYTVQSAETTEITPTNGTFTTRYGLEDNSTKTGTIAWSNSSLFIEETHFNVIGYSGTNITISGNDTVQLNATGNYNAAYSFADDSIGGDPTGWTVVEPADTSVNVIASYAAHTNVVEFYDNSSTGSLQCYNDFAGQATGTIQFWIYGGANTLSCDSRIQTGTTVNVYLQWYFDAGILRAYYSSAWHTLTNIALGEWYHVTIAFDCVTDTYTVELNANGTAMAANFYILGTALNRLIFAGIGDSLAYSYIDAVDYSWTTGYFPNRNLNNTYFANGIYTSKSYDLGDGDYWSYQNLTYFQNLGLDTNLVLEYRTSPDNSSWGAWSSPLTANISIGSNGERYFQFRANLTSQGNFTNTPQLFWANLTYNLSDLLYYESHFQLNTTLTNQAYFHNATLILDITTGFSEINSSIEIYNYSSASYQNISKVQDLTYPLALNQNSSTGLILVNFSMYSSTPFTLIFNESYVIANNSDFLRYCYMNISDAIDLTEYEELSMWYNFSDTRAALYLQFYNTSWYNISQFNSTPLTVGLANGSATTRFWQYWRNITLDNNYTRIRLYFILPDPIDENDTVIFQAKRFEVINESDYRLESDANRQRYDILEFDQDEETLLIIDFAGREIYHQLISFSTFIDIYINIAEVALINYLNSTVWVEFESRGVAIAYAVPAGSQRNVLILLDDYFVTIRRDNLTIIDIREVSITSTNKTTIEIGVPPAEIIIPATPSLLELLWEAICVIWTWLTTDPLGIFIFILIWIYVIFRLWRWRRKRQQKYNALYWQGFSDGLNTRKDLTQKELDKMRRKEPGVFWG